MEPLYIERNETVSKRPEVGYRMCAEHAQEQVTSHGDDAGSIPAKPVHNSDTDSVHFNHFYCIGICNKLSRHLLILTYIYLNVDEC